MRRRVGAVRGAGPAGAPALALAGSRRSLPPKPPGGGTFSCAPRSVAHSDAASWQVAKAAFSRGLGPAGPLPWRSQARAGPSPKTPWGRDFLVCPAIGCALRRCIVAGFGNAMNLCRGVVHHAQSVPPHARTRVARHIARRGGSACYLRFRPPPASPRPPPYASDSSPASPATMPPPHALVTAGHARPVPPPGGFGGGTAQACEAPG
jgi:hypothetical protein